MEIFAPVKPSNIHADLISKFDQAAVRPECLVEVQAIANKIKLNQSRYHSIEAATGVPWYVIGCIHHKECSLDFRGYLGNGELIINTDRKSRLVPAGRGPFKTFEAGAIDALGNQKGKPWDLGSALYFLEGYNGFGYRSHGINSPYLFAATTAYTSGGYPRDHVWDANYVIKNPGCVAVIKELNVFPEAKAA